LLRWDAVVVGRVALDMERAERSGQCTGVKYYVGRKQERDTLSSIYARDQKDGERRVFGGFS